MRSASLRLTTLLILTAENFIYCFCFLIVLFAWKKTEKYFYFYFFFWNGNQTKGQDCMIEKWMQTYANQEHFSVFVLLTHRPPWTLRDVILSIKSCDVWCNCFCINTTTSTQTRPILISKESKKKGFPRKPFKTTNQLTNQLITCFCNAKYFLSIVLAIHFNYFFHSKIFKQIKYFSVHFDYFMMRAATNCAFAWDMFWWFNQSLILNL